MYCKTHKSCYCYKCAVANHSNCDISDLPDTSKFDTIIDMVEMLMDQVQKHSKVYWSGKNWISTTNELRNITDELDMLKQTIKRSIKSNDYCKLIDLENSLLQFKNYFDSSQCVQRYLLESSYNQGITIPVQKNKTSYDIIEEQILDEINRSQQEKLERKYKEVEDRARDTKINYQNKFKQTIEILEQSQANSKIEIEKLTAKNQRIIEDCKNEVNRIQAKIEYNERETELFKQDLADMLQEGSENIQINMHCVPNKQIEAISRLSKIKFIKNLWLCEVAPK